MRIATLSEMLEEVVRLGEVTGTEEHGHELRGELEGRLAAVRAAVAGTGSPRVIALQRLDPPQALDNTPLLGLDALTREPHATAEPPAGDIRGLVAATAGALLIVEQPQASLWGDAAPLAPEAHDLRRWLGWRVVRSA